MKVKFYLKRSKILLLALGLQGSHFAGAYSVADASSGHAASADKWLKTAGMSARSKTVIDIGGKVVDDAGQPLPGVSIVLKGTTTGTSTDANGNFSLNVPANNGVLVFSYIGFASQEVAINNRSVINITLSPDAKSLEEVVVIGYGTQKRGHVTGSIATVKGEEIAVAPVANATNTLAGRLPGLVSLQSSGQPGADAASLSIRGFGGALVIVDGVEGDLNTVDASEIESVSILKDASAAIYGSRAGNGVILITTKRGNTSKPTITFATTRTLQQVTTMLKPASAGQYAEMESEAWLNAGKPANQVPYTPDQIQKYYAGTDPQFPNTDWHKEVIRPYAPQQEYDLSIRGGSEKIKYFGFLGYLDQQSMWKNNGGGYKRYNVKANFDAQILENLSLRMDLASVVEDREGTAREQGIGGGIWQDYWTTRPIYPAHFPDPTKIPFGGNDVGGIHASSNSDIFGYNRNDNQTLSGILSLNYDFKAIKGLSAKVFSNYRQGYHTGKRFTKPAKFYTYDYASDAYALAGAWGAAAALDMSKNESKVLTNQYSFKYDHTFGEAHHLTGLALYETIDYSNTSLSAGRVNFLSTSIDQMYAGSTEGMSNNGGASEMGRKSFVGRFTYAFKEKYLLASTFRADASAKFPADKRWGYFPSVSLGWVASQENFMSSIANLNFLKLRASYGTSGNDGVGNFQYLSGYRLANNYVFGSGGEQPGLAAMGLANPNLTWEKIAISNVGLEFSLWERKLYGEADAFYRERNGIPASRATSLPSSFGANLPPENLNSLNDRGFELKLGTAGSASDFTWDLSGNVSWSRARWDHVEEPAYTDADQARINKRSGRWTDVQFGYLSDGLFTSQEQIEDLAFNQDQKGNLTLRPGDIRYKDTNSDGKLDWKDQVEIGKGTTPHWMVGSNINLTYKNFYLSSLLQGAMGYYKNVILTYKVGNLMRPSIIYDLRWSPTNNVGDALEPRLGGAVTNDYGSDYRYKQAGYLRLKAFSIGYSIPKKWLGYAGLNQVKVFAAGTNLFTLDKLKKYGIDPEAPSGSQRATFYYPQQKTFSLGLSLSL